MSNFRGVATVTATLQRVLQAALVLDVPGAVVTTVRPAEGEDAGTPATGANVFLYQVNPNPHGRNADLPSRRLDGELAQVPVAALDLFYLVSFYGAEATLEAQRLLGSTLAYLHTQPILPRSEIEAAVANNAFLADSDLAEQVDVVRFTPLGMTLEEMSRLWSVLLQVKYAVSVAFRASVVLIQRQVKPQPSLPVRAMDLAALTLRRPVITRVVAEAGQGAPITAGVGVAIEGSGLAEQVTTVEIDGTAAPTTQVRGERITLTLPAALAAGPHGVQVRHGVRVGVPGVRHLAFGSNASSFVVQPVITRTNNIPDVDVTDVTGQGDAPRSATVRVGVAPPALTRQTVLLELLGPQGVEYTFRAEERSVASAELTFRISGVAAGTYVVRVRIDGADSPLDLDQAGVPVGPEGVIP